MFQIYPEREEHNAMKGAKVNTVELEYERIGAGPPMLLIHGAHVADSLLPLTREPALSDFETIRYHRRGFAGSSHPPGPTSVAEQADDAADLLAYLGVEQAHIVAHSLGGVIALELAARHPDAVQSLSVLEPPIVSGGPPRAELIAAVTALLERYTQGDPGGAVDGFLDLGFGPDSHAILERALPGAVDQAKEDASTFFEIELPVLGHWHLEPEQTAAITCPVLSVIGTNSGPEHAEVRHVLHQWFPHCRDADIPGATHLLQIEAPRQVAEALASFLATN